MCFWNIDNDSCCVLCHPCLASLPAVHLPSCSQADHVTVPSYPSKSGILNRSSESLRIWTLRHPPPFLALPEGPRCTRYESSWLPKHGFLGFALALVAFFVMSFLEFQDFWLQLVWLLFQSVLLDSGWWPVCSPPRGTCSHTHCGGTLHC